MYQLTAFTAMLTVCVLVTNLMSQPLDYWSVNTMSWPLGHCLPNEWGTPV